MEHLVSNNIQIWCFFPSRCNNMVMMGRVPCVSHFGFFDQVPALGSWFFRFRDSPHIVVEVSGCGGS